MTETQSQKVIIYGTDWCPDCIRAKLVLKKLGVTFTYINTDKDEEAEELIRKLNEGQRIVPTILFPDHSKLIEPSNRELTEKVISLDLVPNN